MLVLRTIVKSGSGTPPVLLVQCDVCLMAHQVKQWKWNARNRKACASCSARAASLKRWETRPRKGNVYHCSLCGAEGHNRATCATSRPSTIR